MVEAGHQAGARPQAPGEVGVEVDVVGLQVLLEALGVGIGVREVEQEAADRCRAGVWVSARVVDQEPPPRSRS